MLDIQFIRENPSLVQKAAESKGTRVSVDHLLEIDHEVRKLSQEVQARLHFLRKFSYFMIYFKKMINAYPSPFAFGSFLYEAWVFPDKLYVKHIRLISNS